METKSKTTIKMIFIFIAAIVFCTEECIGQRKIELEISANEVGKYEKLEMQIKVDNHYDNPFDPNEVDLVILLRSPGSEQITIPAFYFQDYERRQFQQKRKIINWYYPKDEGIWKVRFAPLETGVYSVRARLKDKNSTIYSKSIRFECIASSRKGFVRISKEDPRFLGFTEGETFFAIGQNLAFVGENQYVNLTKAEEIFDKLSQNGANFLRIWTCCEDWAMAIEAKKSAWERSWSRKKTVVPLPGDENESNPRNCIKLNGKDGSSLEVSPSHPVALRPGRRYVITGQFMANEQIGLKLETVRGDNTTIFNAAPKGQWKRFRQVFVTGQDDFWLGRMVFRLVGSGTIWLDKLSLKEVGKEPELLWEADVNRPKRGLYNPLDCFMLDKLVEAAEENEVYLMLCLITRDLYMNSLKDEFSSEYQQAISDAKKLMRYAVARWGYSTNVAAWEYFNEINPGLPTDRFYKEVGEYLEQIDVYNHLRTTSTWSPSAKDLHHRDLDIGQLHHYMRPETKENFKDEVAVLIEKTQFLREHAPSKPVLIGEFGLATPKWGLSEYMKQDSGGVHFHNCLWASAFAGSSGTALFWWWDQLDKQDTYDHYRPLAEFLRNISFSGLRKADVVTSEKQIQILGYQTERCAYLWLFNRQATWWNLVVEKQKSSEIKEAAIDIKGLELADYLIEWWDTRNGRIIKEDRVSLKTDFLHVLIPPFSQDIACKIEQLK